MEAVDSVCHWKDDQPATKNLCERKGLLTVCKAGQSVCKLANVPGYDVVLLDI